MTCAHTDSPRNQIHLDHLSHRDLGGWHVQLVLRNELRFGLSDKLVLSPARPLMMAMRMLVLGVCTRMDVSCRLSPVCSPESCASAVGEPRRTDTASARQRVTLRTCTCCVSSLCSLKLIPALPACKEAARARFDTRQQPGEITVSGDQWLLMKQSQHTTLPLSGRRALTCSDRWTNACVIVAAARLALLQPALRCSLQELLGEALWQERMRASSRHRCRTPFDLEEWTTPWYYKITELNRNGVSASIA